jgi:hypothetical protein
MFVPKNKNIDAKRLFRPSLEPSRFEDALTLILTMIGKIK